MIPYCVKKPAFNQEPLNKITEIPDKHRIFSRTAIQIIIIISLSIAVYANTFNSPFLFDDSMYIADNPIIKEPLIFLESDKIDTLPGAMQDIKEKFRNRMVGHFSFALNYMIHGFNVTGYHMVNLLIHLLNALLVYLLIILTFKTHFLISRVAADSSFNENTPKTIAFLCTLLFAAHPIQTQAVTYITQRFTSLATLFYLLSLVFYIKARLSETSIRSYVLYALALVSAICGMKTKEISFTLPVIVVLYEFMFLDGRLKQRLACLVPFLLTLAIIPLTLLYSTSSDSLFKSILEASQETAYISRSDYLFTQFSVITTYIRLLFFPAVQNLDYDYPIYDSFFMPQVWLPFLFLLSLLMLAAYLFHRAQKESAFAWSFRLISFCLLYFFITLSVESSIIPIKDVIFEHRVYLPSFGFFFCFTVCVIMIKNRLRKPFNKAVIPAFLCVIIILAGAAYARNAVWSSSLSLWQDVVKKSPLKARAHSDLGLAYYQNGNLDAALSEYLTALRLMPNQPYAHNNLGLLYRKTDRIAEAIEEFVVAIKLKPDFYAAHNNLGMCYDSVGRLDEAVSEFIISIKMKPDFVEPHNNLGITLFKKGRFEEAQKEFLRALQLNPASVQTHMNLAVYYEKTGDISSAVKEYLKVAELDPTFIDAIRRAESLSRQLPGKSFE